MMNADPHLIGKIETCPTVEELDALRDAIQARGEELPGKVVQALARRRVHLQRSGKR